VIAQVCHPAEAKLRASGRPMNPHPAMKTDFVMVQPGILEKQNPLQMSQVFFPHPCINR
jgi:hypothetical protein